MSSASPLNLTIDRGSDWSKVLTLTDSGGAPVPITDIFTSDISISGTTSPSVAADPLTYVSADLWTSNGSATVPGSGTWIRVRRSSGAWEITKWVNGSQVSGHWTSDTTPNHPAWVESWTAGDGATGDPVVDSDGMFFEGSISLKERGPDIIPFRFTTVGDGTAGQVEISLSRSYTRSLASVGAYQFDWFVYWGRSRKRLVAGRITARGSSTGVATGIPVPAFGNSPSVAWGSISGTLSNQADLQAALDAGAVINVGTQSDGTADLDLLNVTTATATVTGTLTADHIHGNLAGELYAHIRAGENLAKGDPVYVSGSHGTGDALIAVASKADASDPAKMPAVGIIGAAVAANANGHMVIAGTIPDLDTSGYAVNAELYVAPGGGMTATPPTARAQPVARVERSNASNGAILVKVNGLSASAATVNTLVRRDGNGGASFGGVDVTTLTTSGIITTGQVEFNGTDAGDLLTFNMVNYAYGTGAADAHRTALGVGTADSPTFGGADFFTSTTTTLNVYNILSGDNFERLSFRWASNVARIGTAKGGTGSARDLVLETDGTERVRVSGDGSALSIAVGTNRTLTINQADGLSTNGSIITTANVFANGVFSAQSTSTNSQFTNRNGLGITVKAGTTGTGGFVGIGTTNPTSKLSVFSGDIEAETIGNGIILKSPNGTRWRFTVDNTGALTPTAL